MVAGQVDWGSAPQYLTILTVVGSAIAFFLRRQREVSLAAAERFRLARLNDLIVAWHALAPLVAYPGGFDDTILAQNFAHAVRQLQLSASGDVFEEARKVIEVLVEQGATSQNMAIDLTDLIEAVRREYRSLLNLPEADVKYMPFRIISKEENEALGGGGKRT